MSSNLDRKTRIYKKMKSKINIWLKYIIILLLISLAILSVYFKYDNCNQCKFNLDNKNINAKEFMNIYSKNCLNSSNSFNGLSSLLQSSNSTKTSMS